MDHVERNQILLILTVLALEKHIDLPLMRPVIALPRRQSIPYHRNQIVDLTLRCSLRCFRTDRGLVVFVILDVGGRVPASCDAGQLLLRDLSFFDVSHRYCSIFAGCGGVPLPVAAQIESWGPMSPVLNLTSTWEIQHVRSVITTILHIGVEILIIIIIHDALYCCAARLPNFDRLAVAIC